MKKILKILLLWAVIVAVQLWSPVSGIQVYAYDGSLGETIDINQQFDLDILDFKDVNTILGQREKAYAFDFEDMVTKAVQGELDLSFSGIINGFFKMVFNELYENMGLLKNLLIIGILSAILKNLTDSFKSKSVGEVGFYVSYVALIIVLFSSFRIGAGILQSLVITVSDFINAAVPLITSLVFMSGNVTGAYVFNSILFFAIKLITGLVRDLFAPFIVLVSTLQIVNYLTESETLTKLSELLKSIIAWALKGVAILFVSILTIQKISSPILNTLALKTAKSTVNVVPVVGEILTGAVDSVLYWVQACKSGVLVAVLMGIIALCAIPIIKLIALIAVYKVTAAVIQPICDKRIVSCIDTIGDYTVLMLSAGIIVVVMFIFAAMVLLSF